MINDAPLFKVAAFNVALFDVTLLTLHEKWSFPLRIFSVNMTKSAGNCGFGHIYWRNPQWKTSLYCAVLILNYFHVALFQYCTIWCSTFFVLHFYCCTIWCCIILILNNLMLHYLLHYFNVLLFFVALIFITLFHIALFQNFNFGCCTNSMLQ